MRGAIAAGHPVTAEVGRASPRERRERGRRGGRGGRASWVAESPLTGPGGGGFMLVHRARDRSTRLLDFFVTVPSGGADVGGDGRSRRPVRQPDDTALPDRSRLRRGAGHSRRSRACAPALRIASLARARRAGGRPCAPRGRGHADAGLPARHPRADRRPLARRAASCCASSISQRRSNESPTRARRSSTPARSRRRSATQRRRSRRTISPAIRVITRRPVTATFRGHDFASNPPPVVGRSADRVRPALLDARGRFEVAPT